VEYILESNNYLEEQLMNPISDYKWCSCNNWIFFHNKACSIENTKAQEPKEKATIPQTNCGIPTSEYHGSLYTTMND
jgi:hypothetical protein